jgi:hypothetical protein
MTLRGEIPRKHGMTLRGEIPRKLGMRLRGEIPRSAQDDIQSSLLSASDKPSGSPWRIMPIIRDPK